MKWHEVESLAHWVLRTRFKQRDSRDLIGEAYLAYEKTLGAYESSQGNFLSYYRLVLTSHMINYFRYNCSLVHVPVMKDDEISISYLDAPIYSDSKATLSELLSDPYVEYYNEESDLQEQLLAICDSIKVVGREKECMEMYKKRILGTDAKIPKEYRTSACNVAKKIKKKYFN